ncbi:MAG: IPT/TIG domain-containing protein [Armatimonadota bacterium]|nr:IPT/TIG domain-containing protein [Armatimonadota bacterium]
MRPHIVRIEPPATTGYEAGQKLTLIGWGFSPNKTDNTIRLFKTLVGGSQGELTTMHPSVCSTEVIEFNLPSRMEPGQYAVQVSVKKDSGVVDTNRVEFSIKSPPPPAPVIDSIAPSQYPGRKAIITGRNFQKTSNPMLGVWFLPMDEQPLVNYVMFEGEKAAFTLGNVLSDTQMEITIPNTLLPGNYQVVTAVGGQVSNRLVYPVRAYRYQVNFLKLRCVDESDPERWGSDEVVTTWVIARDTEAWAKNTGEYGDMDDGDERNYAPGDRVVFLPGAGPGEVKMVLAIGTSLYEWDAGDVKAANQVIGFVADLATRLLNYFGMKSIGEIVQALKGVVQKLISWLGGDPDHLGTRYIAWTALDLLQATNNPQRRFTGTLQFRNNDDTGSYDVIYEVIRVE